MPRKPSAKKIKKLQTQNLPHFNWEKRIQITGHAAGLTAMNDCKIAITEYFDQFIESDNCPGCGKKLTPSSDIMGLLGEGTFVWGITTGEGHCSHCGYPARAHHNIPEIMTLNNYVLAYHPDMLGEE